MKKTPHLRSLSMTIILAYAVFSATIAVAQPFAYVSNFGSDNLSVIDTSNNTVVDTVTVGDSPFGIAITSDASRAYVANLGSNNVSVIDITSNTVVAMVNVEKNPIGIAISADNAHVYVTNLGSDTVSVIDTTENAVVATIVVGTEPAAIAIAKDGLHIYVANRSSNDVSVIDTTNNTVTDIIAVGQRPDSVAVTPDGLHVYVANVNSNTVSIIETTFNTVEDIVPVRNQPEHVAVTPDGLYVYVTRLGSNNVSVIDTTLHTIRNTISVGNRPASAAILADGSYVYVANSNSNNISVIDTSSNAVVHTIAVGVRPLSIAFTPENSNTKPVAHAGGNKSVWVGDTVELDGTASTDKEGDTLTFNWYFVSKPLGSQATLSSATSSRTSFVADVNGTYEVNLIVNDGSIDSDPQSVNILSTTVLDALTQVLHDAITAINNIAPSNFKHPILKNILTKKINIVIHQISHNRYRRAQHRLSHDILRKMDGCANNAQPDRNDWITTCSEQDVVYNLITEAIETINAQSHHRTRTHRERARQLKQLKKRFSTFYKKHKR